MKDWKWGEEEDKDVVVVVEEERKKYLQLNNQTAALQSQHTHNEIFTFAIENK